MDKHKTNRYRVPEKGLAYEVALVVASVMTDFQLNASNMGPAKLRGETLPAHFSRVFGLSFDDAREVLSKAYRIERGKRRNAHGQV